MSLKRTIYLHLLTLNEHCRDPYIARRLQHLKLRLTHVKAIHHSGGSQEKAKDLKQLKQQFYLIVNRVFKIKRAQREIDSVALGMSDPRQSRPTFNDVMGAVIDATPQFVNVTELTIDAWDLPPLYGNLEVLFTSFWTTFGANLRRLSLGGNLEGYRILIESKPRFTQLEALRVEFTNNVFRVDQAADSAILVDVVAPFINSLNLSLEALEIWSWANLDLSMFFQRLVVPPALKHLNVRMAFNRTLADPSGLKWLLCEGSETLEKLDIRLNPSRLFPTTPEEERLSRWLVHCIDDKRCFAKLRHLDIYPTNTEVGINVLLTSIKRASETLVHLTIRDRYFLQGEATLILEAASRCKSLTYLRMNIWKLNITLLDLFAAHVPCVEHLWLSLSAASSNNEHGIFGVRDLTLLY